jgi:CBS domain containing-hemolysin-like protein
MTFILIIIFSLLFAAFFSGMEVAFLCSNKLRIELNIKQGRFPAGIVNIFTNQPGQYLFTMTAGYLTALVLFGTAAAAEYIPVFLRFTSSVFLSVCILFAIAFPVFFVAADYLPKILFRINPNMMLNLFAIPAFIFYILFYPVVWLLKGVAIIILRIFAGYPLQKTNNNSVFGKIDWTGLVDEEQTVTKEEQDAEHEIKIFQNALDFSSVKIRDCMIPRTDIVAIDEDSTIAELKQKFIDTGVSKIIVYKEDIDNIIGYVHSKKLFNNPGTIQAMVNTLTFVPESMSGNKMMQLFMQERRSIAIVVDEYGGTSGLLTLEDLIEEIFGDIEDEHDKDNLVEQQLKKNEFLFSGRLEIEYINETYHLNIPEKDDYETLAGFILYHHLNFPLAGEMIHIGRFTFVIRKMSNTRIDLVQMIINK